MIIDTDDYAASGIKTLIFSGGEPHVEIPEFAAERVHIYAKIRTPQDFMLFMAVLDALQCQGTAAHVFMPYLPGARQDRKQEGFAFTCDLMADMFATRMPTVTAVDVHSDKALQTYRNYMDVRVLPLGPIVKRLIPVTPHFPVVDGGTSWRGRVMVLAPDKGARDRAYEVAHAVECPSIGSCTKTRDSITGHLVTDSVPNFIDCTSHYESVLLADDICDGGATFVGIEKKIHQQAYNLQVDLYVTHGIFSKGFDPLRGFRNIYTTDSFYRGRSEVLTNEGATAVHVLPLLPLYLESLRP
jgi:ribose-phosphate pyrophosphokinase